MEKELTIVIPCKNEEGYIQTLLKEISLQGVGKTKIFLADANSTDKTREKAEESANDLGLNLEIIPGGLPAKGRNNGASLSKTPYILFVDSDVTFTKKFSLKECLDLIKSGDFDMMSSTPIIRGEVNIKASLMFWLNKIGTRILSKKEPFAIGAFTIVKKSKFQDLGGYDEEVKHTEDWLLSRKISPEKFLLIEDLITQDDRRFKKFGYFKMIFLIAKNWINRNNRNYYLKDAGYWK